MLTNPGLVAPMFTGLFMDKMVVFIKLYFPVFLLGAVFGKTIELSRFSKSIVISVINLVGSERAILSIVVVCSILTYGGVSLFVVVFAVYPFAAEMFRRGYIPKRLIPGAIALGAFTFTMDALPGTPQIQNVIPTSFFKTTIYAAPCLGIVGSAFILVTGLSYLNWRRRQALASGEGYGVNVLNESQPNSHVRLPHPLVAILPLLLVAVSNKVFSAAIPALYGQIYSFTPTVVVGKAVPVVQDISAVTAIWAIEGALLVGILSIFALAWKPVTREFTEGSKSAIAGAVMASVNTASVYGFGAVIAGLPGFLVIANASKFISNPLVNEATTVTSLAGITGSASGGLSIALAAMSDTFVQNAKAAGVPLEEFHRIASMASGGLDTLPHNGAVITLLAVTGLTHRQSYGDIFALTLVKTSAVLVCISFYQLTGLV
jgi:H+/gluconate symporter-like permease